MYGARLVLLLMIVHLQVTLILLILMFVWILYANSLHISLVWLLQAGCYSQPVTRHTCMTKEKCSNQQQGPATPPNLAK